LVRQMGWGLRIGLEYGDFISGEIGPEHERIWDFLGETVNYAARLSQNAGKDEILIGPELKKYLEEKIQYEEKIIHLKGIGQQTVYSLLNTEHYEN